MTTISADKMLRTTRSVRKRLDFKKPVAPELIEECLEIAFQAPTGSNMQGWSVVVVTDADKKAAIADVYRKGFEGYAAMRESMPVPYGNDDLRAGQMDRVISSASYLAEHMHEAPALVIFCIEGRVETGPLAAQASIYGSILPAAWSFMLAGRARGLGMAWTTIHLFEEAKVAELLGLPAEVTQSVLFPVAYYTGDDFKEAKRLPAGQLTHWNQWGKHRG
ncbi:MAG: nitroreductase family protein [bacterium]